MQHTNTWRLDLGARPVKDGVQFTVWAPRAQTVCVRLIETDQPAAAHDLAREPIPMNRVGSGYYQVTIPGISSGSRYRYVLNGERERPDPVSRFQPAGVHGPSVVVNPEAFCWSDHNWKGVPLESLIIYELHVGTFTPAGTFQAIIPRLPYLRDDVGVTAIELMPVAQFPGTRNWGYDGAYLYAPQNSYGGPEGLKELVNACHEHGLAVILDVVYNHLGPEGNYLEEYGPYFTDRYRTPWGKAINYDGPESDEVRRYIVSNALYWITEYHIDALRLDAIHGIYDFSARHILRELAEAVHALAAQLERTVLVIAESDLNDVRVIAPIAEGGHGLDAQWNDDFHHALHTLLTGERSGYYEDFGRLDQLATALRDGFVYTGQHSRYRRRRHGSSARHRPPAQFVVFAQNHDQIGNRAQGDRLSTLVPPDALKVAAATVLLAPNTPLLFMGEEYAEVAPFLYFIDHGDPSLIEAVRQGRLEEFRAFGWQAVPDPQDPATFERSCLRQDLIEEPGRLALLRWYRQLITLRKRIPALGAVRDPADQPRIWTFDSEQVLVLQRRAPEGPVALIVLGFNHVPRGIRLQEPKGRWVLQLSGSSREFGGSGDLPPERLLIGPQGSELLLPAYGVCLYLEESA